MALTLTTTLGGRKTVSTKGLKFAKVQVTIGATTDYVVGTGFLVSTIGAAAGIKNVVGVLEVTLKTSGNVYKTGQWIHDETTGGIKFFEAATVAQDEYEQADFATNDVMTVILFGY